MSSSSSSGYSDEDTAASAGRSAAPSASELGQAVELAQVCAFCATFRKPLRLPSFSRTELQEAILGASNGERTHTELLAELHFKLAREHPTAKMEKMVQDWEKTLARKLQDNWRKEFAANPMAGGVTYAQLTVFERVKILDALCHWKLDTCGEIHKHIAALQKENDTAAINRLRAGEIGMDDNGVSYWYFDDGCWIYAEDKPQWQDRKPSYAVEFASAKRIRLSINFDLDHNSSAPPLRLPAKSVAFSDDIKVEKKIKKEELLESATVDKPKVSEPKMKNEGELSRVVKTEEVHLKDEKSPSSVAKDDHTEEHTAPVKEEAITPTSRRTDTGILCGSVSTSSEADGREHDEHFPVISQQSNGSTRKQDGESSSNKEGISATLSALSQTDTLATRQEVKSSMPDKNAISVEKDGSSKCTEMGLPVKVSEDHPSVVAIVGSKKRTIIDDDSSDSSSSDFDTSKTKTVKKEVHQESSSPPPRKRRKASIDNMTSAAPLNSETSNADSTKPVPIQINGTTDSEASQGDPVTSSVSEASPSVSITDVAAVNTKEKSSSPSKAQIKSADELRSPVTGEAQSEVFSKNDESSSTETKKTGDVISTVQRSGPASTSPTDLAAEPESFDITCESCKKCYDMRYVDPPLVERPTDEWRCFECLVNDARGWPRRRKSTRREAFSPRAEESRRRSSSAKSRTGSSSSKKSKKSSSKSRSSSSSKKKTSHSSSSKRKSSSSKSSSSKKSSSSSSSKKHKKRKSSSSSHHHHSSHHRRRHHYYEEFGKLVHLFRDRQDHRLAIEEARIDGGLHVALDEAPQGWRVVSSTFDELRVLIQALSGGSLEQDRLRGRLILILKDQEKREEERIKQQELEWNILPRRQSSRIAIGRMKNQSAQDSDAGDVYSDDDMESRRPGLRAKRSHAATADGVDGTQRHDRAWRARRRHQGSDDDDMDLDDEDEVDNNGSPGNWIEWSLLKDNPRRLSTVCRALVNRLLKEKDADLFSRPVDPELDGCSNYLSVIKQPMDLGTIRSRVEASFYRKWELFKMDVELVWQNCRTYNAPDTMVVQFADILSKLSRSMCIVAEKKGVNRMKDKGSGEDESDHDSDNSLSDASKAESRSSVNKAWTESSASESSGSSDGESSSDGNSDSDARSRKRRSTRTSSNKPQTQTRSRSTRSRRTNSPANTRTSRSSRNRSSKKRPAPTSSSDEESSVSENDEAVSPVRKSRPLRGVSSKADGKVDPPTEEDDGDNAKNNHPTPPQNGALSPSPPPPPPQTPQAVQKRPKPRLIISDSSSSDDSSDSEDNSSSSSSSDSDESDSDAHPANKRPQPPPPSSAEAPAPPPPSPPPPAASPDDSKPPAKSPSRQPKPKRAAGQGKKAKTPSAAKDGATTDYAHSAPMLNSYLSPSSSSSSDFSSGDSDSSDADSDSD